MPDLTTDLARFWAKVEKTDTCWLWTDSLATGGYGAFTSLVLKTKLAHRFAYLALVGPIPDGFELDHTCQIEHCVYPKHLRLVTKLANQHNRKGANRNSSSGYRNVHKAPGGRWRVLLQFDGQMHKGGVYDTAEEANTAAVTLRRQLYRERLGVTDGCKRHGLTDGKYHVDSRGVRHWKCRICAQERNAAAREAKTCGAFFVPSTSAGKAEPATD